MNLTIQKLHRFSVICDYINRYPGGHLEDIRKYVLFSSRYESDGYCKSSLEKDLRCLKEEFDVPIVYLSSSGYELEADFQFWKCALQKISEYIDFPPEIMNLISEIKKEPEK